MGEVPLEQAFSLVWPLMGHRTTSPSRRCTLLEPYGRPARSLLFSKGLLWSDHRVIRPAGASAPPSRPPRPHTWDFGFRVKGLGIGVSRFGFRV